MLYGTRKRRRRREQPGILTYRVAEEKVRVRVECVIRFEELPSAEGGDAAKKRKEKLEKRKRKEREKNPKEQRSTHAPTRYGTARPCLVSIGRRDVIWYSGRLLAHQLCPLSLPPLSLSPSKCAILRRRRLLLSQYIIYIYIYKCTIEPTRNLLLHDSLERFIV